MGCKCKAPIEQYPENAEWGPIFWTLLHGLAELAGKQTVGILQSDERRLWIHLLNSMQPTIPCDICRDHYAAHLKEFPIQDISTIAYTELGTWIRTYLWKLHNIINEENGKPKFPFDQLNATYKKVNITETWKQLEPIMKKAITLSGITLLPWKKFLQYVRSIQGLCG